ncbi:MAG: hypothetical protein HY686_06575 [Chloroflexi bacterium]|nr:hypothetical protein [Chloroflexota bacterium]
MAVGQEVVYVGRVAGAPDWGSWGMVRALRARSALVSFGRRGLWHVPYHLLAVPQEEPHRQVPQRSAGIA